MKSSNTILNKIILPAVTATLLMTSALSADCTYQLFNISSDKGTKISEFVDQLSEECSFSVIISDAQAEKVLKKSLNKTKLKNMTIDEVLNIILTENNLSYTLEDNLLKVSYIRTKTFSIDYILSQRTGTSNTDIILSSKSGTEGTGTTGGAANSQQSSGESETGIAINTTDEVKFWEELDLELQRVLNRPEDTYQAEAPIINKNSGMVTVSATVKQLKRLKTYLEELQKKVQYQVLIDVNLLGVTLSDGSQTGVDWSQLYALQNFNLSADVIGLRNVDTFTDGAISTIADAPASSASLVRMSGGGTLSEVIKFLSTQGDVKAISNPKVLTLNNQPALITVGTEFFYKVEQATNQQGAGGGVVATVQNTVINSVFAGVLLDITPEISNDGTITLKINPSVTQTRETLSADNSKRTMPPDLDRRQLAAVVTVKDGERVILGGLINTRKFKKSNQVPLLGSIPFLGYLFKYEEEQNEVEELVMVIEPHIIKKDGNNLNLSDLGYTGINETNLQDHAFSMRAVREQLETLDQEKHLSNEIDKTEAGKKANE